MNELPNSANVSHGMIRETLIQAIARLCAILQLSRKVLSAALVGLAIVLQYSPVQADMQRCNDPDGGGGACNSSCPPAVNHITPSLLSVSTTGGGQYAMIFRVSYSGSGFHGTQVGTPFKVRAERRVDTFAIVQKGTLSSSNDLTPGQDNICYTLTGDFCDTVIASGGDTVKYWALAYETQNFGAEATCVCSSEVQWVVAPGSATPAPGVGPPLASELGETTCPDPIADPISVTSGNLYLARQDAEIQSDRGLPISLGRNYNSHATGSGKLGRKWRLDVEQSLAIDAVTGNITLTEGTGRAVLFRFHLLQFGAMGQLTYDSPYGVPYKLTVGLGWYKVSRPNNTTLVFNTSGRLDSILDLAGNKVRLHYTAGGVLDTIENASQRKVVFADSSGLLRRIKSVPEDTFLVRFEYYANNMLKKVVYPNGSYEQYDYGTNPYDSLGIVKAVTSDGVTRNWSYNSDGLAVHFHFGGPDSSESVTILNRDTITSGCGGAPTTLRAVVKYGKSSLESHFDYAWAPDWSRREVTGRQSSDCSSCGTGYTYDGIGLPKTISFVNGTVDQYRHDIRGNTLSFRRAFNTSLEQWVLWDYHSTSNLPILERRQSVAKPTDTMSVRYAYSSTTRALDTLIESGRLDTTTSYSYTTKFNNNLAGQLTKVNGPRPDTLVVDTIGYTYGTNGDLASQTMANGDQTTYGPRNSRGQRTWIRSPNGDTTRYTFDSRNRLTRVINAAGTGEADTVTLSYNVDGQVTAINNLGGSGVTFVYDAAGHFTRLSDKLNSFIRYTFDQFGNPKSEEVYRADSTLRKAEYYVYDSLHQLRKAIGPVLDTTILGYDASGNLTSLRNALNKTTEYRYDLLNRPDTILESLGAGNLMTRFEYNSMNLVTKVTDPDNYQYVYKYDDRGRLTYDSSAASGPTRYRYDEASNLVWERNADADTVAGTISYTYDALNRLTARIYADTFDVQFFYDTPDSGYYQRGRLVKEATRACTTKYLHDIRGQVAKEVRRAFICPVRMTGDVDTSGTHTTADVYLLAEYVFETSYIPRPCVATGDVNGSGTVSSADLIYLSNYVSKGGPAPINVCPAIWAGTTWTCPWPTDTVSYEYDRHANLTGITYPSRTRVRYDYDAADNVIRVHGIRRVDSIVVDSVILADSISYAPFGPAESWKLKNKLRVRNDNDLRYLVDTLSAKPDTGSIYWLRYAYTTTKTGNIEQIKDILNATRTRDFAYDDIGRLTGSQSQDYPSPELTYTYSNNGNRSTISKTNPAPPPTYILGTYFHSSNRLDSITGVGAAKFRYDLIGNDTQKVEGGVATAYQYNDAGRMISLTGTSPAIYKYDGRHRRLSKTTGGATKAYIPASSGQPLSEFIQNTWLSDFVYLNGRPLVRYSAITSEKRLYFVNDHLGTPIQLTDSAQTVRWSARWLPFGEIYAESGSASNYIRFPGQWRDTESGHYYNWNRYYRPEVGRYTQPDPLGIAAEANPYSYVGSKPLTYSDPRGLYAPAITYAWPLILSPDPVTKALVIGGAIVIGGAAAWKGIIEPAIATYRERGKSDPVVLPPMNPGRDCEGNCNPCPTPPPPWKRPGNQHGSSSDEHWHWITYDQNPITCECYPRRMSGKSPP